MWPFQDWKSIRVLMEYRQSKVEVVNICLFSKERCRRNLVHQDYWWQFFTLILTQAAPRLDLLCCPCEVICTHKRGASKGYMLRGADFGNRGHKIWKLILLLPCDFELLTLFPQASLSSSENIIIVTPVSRCSIIWSCLHSTYSTWT